MGFVESFKGMFVSVDDEYDEMVDYPQQEQRPVQQQVSPKPAQQQYYEEEVMTPRQPNNKIMSITPSPSQASKIVIKRPTKYEQAPEIGEEIKARKTVFVNLDDTPLDVSRRLLDFLSGVTFAMDGKVDRVANLTYIFAPHDAELVKDGLGSDRMDELETPGIYYN